MTINQRPTPYHRFTRMPIAGVWREGSSRRRLSDTNPYSGEVLTEITPANAADVDQAYSEARRAQRAWAAAEPSERAAVMRRAAQIMQTRRFELVDWLIREIGATRSRAEVEVAIATEVTALAGGQTAHPVTLVDSDVPHKENRVLRRPAGVVTVISPWNFPLYLSNRSVAPALALGNAVVLKPAEDSPVTGGLWLAKAYEEAGLPPGVLSVVIGTGAEIGDHLVEHPVPRVVSFTGSTAVGLGITRKAGVKRLALELGGNGPMVVLDDADLQRALMCAGNGSFYHNGQICMATNRIIVQAPVFDEFVERFVEQTQDLRVGDPADPGTQIGPVINARQLHSIREKIDRAVTDGAKLLLSADPTGPTGQVLPPHVLVGTNDVATARDEVFGPVATIIRADDEDHALRIANATDYGLSSAVFSEDLERALRFAQRIEAGMTHINDTTVHDDVHAPFGGDKQSGYGRFGLGWVDDDFTSRHWISIQHLARPLPY
ncbi:aldehyde dehydrogenase family protein [Streptacidiphilus anmyonensis]|uniref:aldehyde dehydrogenase family protein n=1 Tax=Streptacidiphilus anmyonensis TaxID=405782 RepID=UPI0005A7F616|nr:aldehyde dehydrogenase family protein [Streptacidiphilus anmyonensis]